MADLLSDFSDSDSGTKSQEQSVEWNPISDSDSFNEEDEKIFKNMIPGPMELVNTYVRTSEQKSTTTEKNKEKEDESENENRQPCNLKSTRKNKKKRDTSWSSDDDKKKNKNSWSSDDEERVNTALEGLNIDERLDSISVVAELYPKIPIKTSCSDFGSTVAPRVARKTPKFAPSFDNPSTSRRSSGDNTQNGQQVDRRVSVGATLNSQSHGYTPSYLHPARHQPWYKAWEKKKGNNAGAIRQDHIKKLRADVLSESVYPLSMIHEYGQHFDVKVDFIDAPQKDRDRKLATLPSDHPCAVATATGRFGRILKLTWKRVGTIKEFDCAVAPSDKMAKNEAVKLAIPILFPKDRDDVPDFNCERFGADGQNNKSYSRMEAIEEDQNSIANRKPRGNNRRSFNKRKNFSTSESDSNSDSSDECSFEFHDHSTRPSTDSESPDIKSDSDSTDSNSENDPFSDYKRNIIHTNYSKKLYKIDNLEPYETPGRNDMDQIEIGRFHSHLKKIPKLSDKIYQQYSDFASCQSHNLVCIFVLNETLGKVEHSAFALKNKLIDNKFTKPDEEVHAKDTFDTLFNGVDFGQREFRLKDLKKSGKVIFDWSLLALVKRAFSKYLLAEVEKFFFEQESEIKDATGKSIFCFKSSSKKSHDRHLVLKDEISFHYFTTTSTLGSIDHFCDPRAISSNALNFATRDKNKQIDHNISENLRMRNYGSLLNESDKLLLSQVLGFQKGILTMLLEPIYLETMFFDLSLGSNDDPIEIGKRYEQALKLSLSRGNGLQYNKKIEKRFKRKIVDLSEQVLINYQEDKGKSSIAPDYKQFVSEGDVIVGWNDESHKTTKNINNSLCKSAIFNQLVPLYQKLSGKKIKQTHTYYEVKNSRTELHGQLKEHFGKHLQTPLVNLIIDREPDLKKHKRSIKLTKSFCWETES